MCHDFVVLQYHPDFDGSITTRGINSAMFGIAITQYVYYYWYELVKAGFEKGVAAGRALTIGENMLTGAIAGAHHLEHNDIECVKY